LLINYRRLQQVSGVPAAQGRRADTEEDEPAEKWKAARTREDRFKSTAPNEVWSMDFVVEQTQDGMPFRALTVMDVHTREDVAIEAGQSLKGDDVLGTLNRLKLEPAQLPRVESYSSTISGACFHRRTMQNRKYL
jgi:transposase InsO family protein